jgi:hypothetical protein
MPRDLSVKGCLPASDMPMQLRVTVPNWSIRPAKLLTRSPLALRLIAFLDFATGESSVEATDEDRFARAALRSMSRRKLVRTRLTFQ